jgi:hypothetical protein
MKHFALTLLTLTFALGVYACKPKAGTSLQGQSNASSTAAATQAGSLALASNDQAALNSITGTWNSSCFVSGTNTSLATANSSGYSEWVFTSDSLATLYFYAFNTNNCTGTLLYIDSYHFVSDFAGVDANRSENTVLLSFQASYTAIYDQGILDVANSNQLYGNSQWQLATSFETTGLAASSAETAPFTSGEIDNYVFKVDKDSTGLDYLFFEDKSVTTSLSFDTNFYFVRE